MTMTCAEAKIDHGLPRRTPRACANCKNTIKLIDEVAKAKGVELQLEKVEQIQDIMTYGVMSTPGVVIDGKVVHAGGVPARAKIESWF